MKAKIAPTSPKTQQAQREFEQLYADGMHTIERPHRLPLGLTLLFSFLIGVFSALGALAALTAIQRRADYAWLRWFVPATTEQVVIREPVRAQSDELTAEDDRQAAIAPVVVGIYQNLPDNLAGPNDLPTPDRFRGNGVVVSSNGLVVTTKRVMTDPNGSYSILLADRRLLPVQGIETDTSSPFLFFSVESDSLRSAKFAGKDVVRVGSRAYAYSVSAFAGRFQAEPGFVRALDLRSAEGGAAFVESSDSLDRFLVVSQQSLVPGSVLVNEQGEVIGLADETSARFGQQVFPAWHFRAPLRQLLRGSDLVRPSLGIQTVELGRYPAFDDEVLAGQRKGAVIATDSPADRPAVTPRSPAAEADFRAGDVLFEVGGVAVDALNPVSELIQDLNPGETITIRFRRNGQEERVDVTLGVRRP